jgi:protein O-mannosyl-transferase
MRPKRPSSPPPSDTTRASDPSPASHSAPVRSQALPDFGASPVIWRGCLLLLAAATLAAFAGVLRNGWILLDDPTYVLGNAHINKGLTLEGLRWMMRAPHGGNWHPLTSIAHMLNVQTFGLAPAGHHAVSLVLHALNAVLLAWALARLTRSWWPSLFVAAFFALHPLRVESVAWASELKDVLSGLFFMLVLLGYARWAERPTRGRMALVLVGLALGLAAKPMLVTLPGVLLLLDLWPLGRLQGVSRRDHRDLGAPSRSLAGLVLEKWPMLVVVGVFAGITLLVQHAAGAMESMATLPPAARIANAAQAYWRYLWLTLWPDHLVPFHARTPNVDLAHGAVAIAGLLAVTALAAFQFRRRPYLLVGWLWYLGTLVPVIGLVQVGMQSHADRYTYLTVIGVTIMVSWAADELIPRTRAARFSAAMVMCVVLAALGMSAAGQVARWKDNRTLFEYTRSVDTANPVAAMCLGNELLQSGRALQALPLLETAVHGMPENAEARSSLGSAYGSLGRLEEAVTEFRVSLRTRDDAVAHHNLALTLMKLGRPDEAIVEYEAGLRLAPDDGTTAYELGAALGSRGRLAEAEAALRRARALRPGDAGVMRMLAVTLTNEGNVEEAVAEYGAILRIDSGDLDALNNIAWIRATHADPKHRSGADAVRFAEQAVSHSEQPVAVLYSTLAAAYAEAGRFPDAVRAGTRAVELARSEADPTSGARFAEQLALYRAGRPLHFGR